MDIRQLLCFVEVAKHGSFTRAAESLYLTQPTISKMIKSLEEELEVTLIRRSTKKVELTDAGKVALVQAQKIVESMKSLEDELNDVLQLRRGTVEVGISSMLGGLYFGPIFNFFGQSYPQIDLAVVEGNSVFLQEKLLAGEIDICSLGCPPSRGGIDFQEVYREPLILVVSKVHSLSKKTKVSLKDVKNEKWILFSEGLGISEALHDHIQPQTLEKNCLYRSNQWDFISEMVHQNIGISVVPQGLYDQYLKKTLVGLPIDEELNLLVYLAWKKENYLTIAARQWLEFSKNYFYQKS